MTNDQLPPCLCGEEPMPDQKITPYETSFECDNRNCRLYGVFMTMDEWRALHGPKQALEEIANAIFAARVRPLVNVRPTEYADHHVMPSTQWGEMFELAAKAQQLAGESDG